MYSFIITATRVKPKFWFIAVCTILFTCLFLTLLVAVVLIAVPVAREYTHTITQGDVIMVPMEPSLAWLSDVQINTGIDCNGQFCYSRCNKLALLTEHLKDQVLKRNNIDRIYCLQNSTFTFTLSGSNENKAVWLFDDEPKNNVMTNRNCTTDPTIQGKQVCIELNSTHPSGTTEVWHKGIEGAYYYWRTWPTWSENFTAVIQDWYIYTSNITTYAQCKPFDGRNSPIQVYHQGFQPTNFTSTCLLVYTDKDSNCAKKEITIVPYRRYDVVIWPVLAGVLIILALTVTGIVGATCHYLNRRNRYNQLN